VMLAGGAEAPLTPPVMAGFSSAGTLSTRNEDPAAASRPFDNDRDGFVASEGAAIVALETLERALTRGARIYGEVLGYGSSADAYHISAPAEDGSGAARSMQAALDDAGLAPEAIDYINAHGTSTHFNDKIETKAIHQVFGAHAEHLAVSSTKSMIGHLLGAAGGVETVVTALALRNGVLPPTINLDEPDPECDLDYCPHDAVERDAEYAISNSFGFGGHNVTLCLKARR